MITFTVRMRFRAEDRQQVDGFLHELATASRAEPGCVTYIPHRVESDPDTGMIYEQYRDEAAVEAHRATAHFQRFAVGGLYQRMLDRSVENLTSLA